jgi:UDP-glucose 6-dehydrogenase
MIVSIIGLGFVGSAMEKSFNQKNIKVIVYDKFKNGGIGNFEDCLISEISFLALPTQYNEKEKEYDKKAIYETIDLFNQNKYKGGIVIKSTIEPETLNNLSEMYPSLNLIHNPEFLTARTAFEDFHNQKHIVLGNGKGKKVDEKVGVSPQPQKNKINIGF